MGGGDPAELRALPAVHELASKLDGAPPALAISAARQTIEQQRAAIRAGAPLADDLVAAARERLAHLDALSLRRVINATGVILHTNLGRAPLPAAAREAVTGLAGGLQQPGARASTPARAAVARSTSPRCFAS